MLLATDYAPLNKDVYFTRRIKISLLTWPLLLLKMSDYGRTSDKKLRIKNTPFKILDHKKKLKLRIPSNPLLVLWSNNILGTGTVLQTQVPNNDNSLTMYITHLYKFYTDQQILRIFCPMSKNGMLFTISGT